VDGALVRDGAGAAGGGGETLGRVAAGARRGAGTGAPAEAGAGVRGTDVRISGAVGAGGAPGGGAGVVVGGPEGRSGRGVI
jgi:hypothetical protein